MLIVVSGMAFEARIAQGQGIHTVYGLDTNTLEADMEQAVGHGARGMLSFGTAAGLSPGLASGTIVIARNVLGHTQSFATDSGWNARLSALLPEAIIANVAGVGSPLASVQEKSALFDSSGAAAADMESHLAARVAQRHHLPFAVLRVVLDGAKRALPPAALASTHCDGSINIPGLIGSLMRNPGQIPDLVTLSGDHRQAKRVLMHCGSLRGRLFGFDS